MSDIVQDADSILVRVRDLVKTYTSGTETLRILQGIGFDIKRGSSVAVTGESGSGKSTLLNILGGLDRCDCGSVMVGGAEINGLTESALSSYRSHRVGFIFQFHYLLKDFTALENVMLPAYIAGMKKKDALEKARLLLGDVRLDDRIHHYPSQLSGGERQRVAVARSLVNDPDLVLADEPTGNLDAQNSAMVAELLYAGAGKWGKTLMVVTHDMGVAERAEVRYTLVGGVLRTYGPQIGAPK
ncbi:ABC transporter ATP-binding protein [Treponema primitia]|uniref:ABC transporter ATP-binding protein n=1 Tax=Treponema primitia TaxID=88058 RepID=UPI0002554E72|nr:ABC transporter ATP-binding protein [Treponema primitia]